MSVSVDIAKDIVQILSEEDFSMKFSPVYEPVPRTDLQSVRGLEVFVTPDNVLRERASRGMWSWKITVNIGVIKHIDKLYRAEDIEQLSGLVDEIALVLSDAVLPSFRSAKPVSFNNTPEYIFDHVHQFSVFTSVLSVVYLVGLRSDGQ